MKNENLNFKSVLERIMQYNADKEGLVVKSKEEWIKERGNIRNTYLAGFGTGTVLSLYIGLKDVFNGSEGGVWVMIPLGILCGFITYGIFQLNRTYDTDYDNYVKEIQKNIKAKEEIEAENVKIKKEKAAAAKVESMTKAEPKLKKADNLKIKLAEIQEINVVDISDFKKVVIENEKNIIDKGGDNQLFSFLKVDTFLRDYRGRIISDQSGLNEVLDIEWLKSRILSESQRNDLDKIIENLDDMSARMEGGRTKGFDSNLDKLFELGDLMKPTLENQIRTMEYYRNMAVAMIVFYLNDNKIRYFEIYEAFEKLGVFDSTWQKNVLNKLDTIEIRLAQISNQLTELNQSFVSLVESSENIVSELKEINSGIMTNNLLQAITAYQVWRVKKKLN
jgi:hypothetical protein